MRRTAFSAILALLIVASSRAFAAELSEVRQLFIKGEYDSVITEASAGETREGWVQDWGLLRAEALYRRGRYSDARAAIELQLKTFPNSLQVRLLGYEVFRSNGDPERAEMLLQEMDRLGAREWNYSDPADRVALGRAAVLVHSDPKKVLERYFSPVKKLVPEFRDAYLACGELALAKSDSALAAKFFNEAAQRFSDDPDVQFGLARAFRGSDVEAMQAALLATLKANPNHAGALLMLAEYHIDAEHPTEAGQALDAVLKIDPLRPEAHALRAVQAELAGDSAGFQTARTAALRPWPQNPGVEYLIGRKLSQKYRFAEGAAHQRQALEWESDDLAVQLQLAQDLLRLGRETEGWKLAQAVRDADPYNVFAYNLVTLEEQLSKFAALHSEHFLVRMEANEAAIYGSRVLELLERAHAQVAAKYGLDPKQKTTVEIFSDQKDFAIRTFGLPGGQGYLGVCFGSVITALSPAAMGGAHNWEAVLWHEFTHVVTLGLTKNRMPRWLSEGISVYEERQARGTWGEQMKPRYRAMILGQDMVPLSQLSGSFLRPKSPVHLQFAYYESSLAVEFLVERFGLATMKTIFADLANGMPLTTSLAKRAAPLDALDREFAERAQKLAREVAPELDWTSPTPAESANKTKLAEWAAAHPLNYYALQTQAQLAAAKRDWSASKTALLELTSKYPDQREAEGTYSLLAQVYRETNEPEEELATLTKLVGLTSDAAAALERLLEIHAERAEWGKVAQYADQLAAINPLGPTSHRFAAKAWLAQQQPQRAIAEYRTIIQIGAGPLADAHFQLATLLNKSNQRADAKRHTLQALEEAPRYRDALKLLLELEAKK